MSKPNSERMDWYSEFGNENEFSILPKDTEVEFTVVEFKRAKSANGNNMAKLTLRCTTKDGYEGNVLENLVLVRTCEWKICQFFTCVGLRKHGDRGTLKWDSLLGSKGRAILGEDTYEKNGKTYPCNVIAKYLEPEEVSAIADDEDIF